MTTAAQAQPEITREEADQIAARWVAESATPSQPLTPAIREFDVGYIVWGQPPPGSPPIVGAGRGIIDRETGELSVWPSLPVETIIEQFRSRRAERPRTEHTWDPADQVRRDLRRVVTPGTLTFLTLKTELVTARSVKGPAEPNHHRLVRQFMDEELRPEHRERGYERCSEAAALSDALHLEDARRAAAGEDPVTLEDAGDVFAEAGMITYRVREAGDRVAGESTPPCISCAFLTRHFGFRLDLPSMETRDGETPQPPTWRLQR